MKNKTDAELLTELKNVNNRIERIVADVNSYVDRSLADYKESLEKEIEERGLNK